MNRQRQLWEGRFGDSYTNRNNVSYSDHLPILGTMLPNVSSVLEIGCNKGHNLRALKHLGVERVIGVDVNKLALEKAKECYCDVVYGDALELPFDDSSFELVLTMGVLIHISPDNLPVAISEMYRVSNSLLLVLEYPSDEEVMVHYRGNDLALWKRDFRKEFMKVYPSLKLLDHQSWGTEDRPFHERLDGWLFEK